MSYFNISYISLLLLLLAFEDLLDCMIESKYLYFPQELISTAVEDSTVWTKVKNTVPSIFKSQK